MGSVAKRVILIARLVPTPEAYEGKTNENIAKEIQAEKPAIPYVAEIERISVFNSPSGRDEVAAFKRAVMDAMTPVHNVLGEATRKLAEQGIQTQMMFDASKGILVVVLEKQREEG